MINSARISALVLGVVVSCVSQAAQVNVTSVLSSAQTSYKSDNQGSPIDVGNSQLNVAGPGNAFSDLGPLPAIPVSATATAFQGANGSDAVSVQGAFANGATFNTVASTATFSLTGILVGDPTQRYRVFLDYSVLPGIVGLRAPRNQFQPSEAEISFTVEALGPNLDLPADRGVFAQLILFNSGNSNFDPGFTLGQPTTGSTTLDNIPYNIISTAAFTGTANLGQYGNGDTVAFNYILEAHVTQPGLEIYGVAAVGDPLALHANPGRIANYVLRLEPIMTTDVPAPTALGLLLAALCLLALSRLDPERGCLVRANLVRANSGTMRT